MRPETDFRLQKMREMKHFILLLAVLAIAQSSKVPVTSRKWGSADLGDYCYYHHDCSSNYCHNYKCVLHEFNINCGGYSDWRFTGDKNNHTPKWFYVNGHPKYPRDSGNHVHHISGAESKNEFALKTHKWGPHGSTIKYYVSYLAPGTWECTLHFAETSSDWSHKGKRVFNAYLYTGGWSKVYHDIDVYGSVGGYKSKTYTYKYIGVYNGYIGVTLSSVRGNPFISAITCRKY